MCCEDEDIVENQNEERMAASSTEIKTTDNKKEETTTTATAGGEVINKAEDTSNAKKSNESTSDAATIATAADVKKDESSSTTGAGAVEKEEKDETTKAAATTATATPEGDDEPAAAAEVSAASEEATTADPTAPTEQDHRNRRVYVGNLAWGVSWQDLKDHMKTSGFDVNRANIMMTPDGRSKGCGIVEFATAEGAQKGVETLNDTELNGRQIFVREDREDRGGGNSGGGGGGGGQRPQYGQQNRNHGGGGGGGASQQPSSSGESKSLRVYVGNLSWDVAWQDLKDHMRQAGEVVHAEVISESNGRSKGCGIVEFATIEEAQEAITSLTDTELKGRPIFVREDRETAGGGSSGRGGGGYGGRGGGRGRGRGRGGRYRNHGGRGGGGGGGQHYQQDQNHDGGNNNNNGEASSSGAGGCQLFVGQLSYDTTWRELKDHFRQCGDVERSEVMSNMDGRSKGFGTVRFYNKKDADSAIERLNGVELQGRSLVVRVDSKAK